MRFILSHSFFIFDTSNLVRLATPCSNSSSSWANLFRLLLITAKLVNKPPGQRLVTNMAPQSMAACLMISAACLFVPTNKIGPFAAACCKNKEAAVKASIVLIMSMIWILLRLVKIYGFIKGFHFLVSWPNCTPDFKNSLISGSFTDACLPGTWFGVFSGVVCFSGLGSVVFSILSIFLFSSTRLFQPCQPLYRQQSGTRN